MAKFYGTGTKMVKEKIDGENVSSLKTFIVTFDEDQVRPLSRVQQVNGIERKARAEGIALTGIYPMANSRDNGTVMTKGMRAQKAAAHAKQQAAFKKKLARAAR